MASVESKDRNFGALSTPRNDGDEVAPVSMVPNETLGQASGDTRENSETCTSTSGGEADEKDSGDTSRELESMENPEKAVGGRTPELKHRIRAERNKISAEKSRHRQKHRTEELERDVMRKRIENKEKKANVDWYRARVSETILAIENFMPREEAMLKYRAVYQAQGIIADTMEKCIWTFRDPKGEKKTEHKLKIERH